MLFFGGYKHENIWVIIGDVRIWETNKQKLFGVYIDRKLSFDEHVPNLCQKAGRKLSVLAGLSRFMILTQKTVLMKSLAESQFDYCPLIWCFMVEYWIEKSITYTSDHCEWYIETA